MIQVNYIYTVERYLAVSYPYRPLYKLCDWIDCFRYQVYGEVPLIEPGFTRTFSFRDGWSEPISVHDLSENVRNKIQRIQNVLIVYHRFLNFENSCKMRYVPIGYGAELMHSLILQDERLLEAYSKLRKSTPDAVIEEMKLRKQEIIDIFVFLCDTERIIREYIDNNEFQKANEYIASEAARLNL